MKNIIIKIDGKEIEAQVSEEEIKKLTEEKEWPRNGVYYYYITASVRSSDGTPISIKMWDEDNDFCTINADIGNVYRTEEEAKAAIRAQKLIAAVAKRRKELNGDWVPEWRNSNKCRSYFLVLDETDHSVGMIGEFSVDSRAYYFQADIFGLYHSVEAVQTIIAEFHDELLWYFTEYLLSIN